MGEIKFNSKKYWNDRYNNNGNSGLGSYNDEAKFKADYINNTIENLKIETISDLGCGDGNQLLFIRGFSSYYGYDVSEKAVEMCNVRFSGVNKMYFYNNIDDLPISDLSMSLDVTYHIIEDEYFNTYMKDLFNKSNKYVLIYSIDSDNSNGFAIHLKNRKIKDWIQTNIKDFKFMSYTKYDKKNNGVGFFMYEKI